MMDRRENFLRFINHESHDHIPCLLDVCMVGNDSETFENGPMEGGLDGFGCGWVKTASAMGAGTPAPGDPVLSDVTEWRDQVQFPNVAEFDWEGLAKQQLEQFNPETQVLDYACWNGQFLRVTHLLGVEEGLISLMTEPEASEELLSAITDYRIETLPYIKKYFNPDMVTIYDDVATSANLFIPPAVYEELIAPQHKRWFEAVRSLDMVPSIHICGRCEDIVPGLVDEGVDVWEICEPLNDLPALAEQVGDKLAFFGGMSMQSELALKTPTDEELVQAARDAIDAYGPCGNYGFMGMLMFEDPAQFGRCFMALNMEAINYGTNYYA